MRKPDSLRAALVAGIVDETGARILERDPDKLSIFLDKGRIRIRHGAQRGFEWTYRLSLVLVEYPAHLPNAAALIVADWLRVHQPELLLNHESGNSAIEFEADIIDEKTVDLQLEIELSEAIRVEPREGGGVDLVYVPEPPVLDPVLAEALGLVVANGETVIGG